MDYVFEKRRMKKNFRRLRSIALTSASLLARNLLISRINDYTYEKFQSVMAHVLYYKFLINIKTKKARCIKIIFTF